MIEEMSEINNKATFNNYHNKKSDYFINL